MSLPTGEAMARIRTIKPDFWTDEKVVELSPFARLLFIGLWNFADDEGRMVYSPKKIKMQIFPSDSIEVSELIGELRREMVVNIYTESRRIPPNCPDLSDYQEETIILQIVNFSSHQKIDKRSRSKLPLIPHNPAESRRIPPTEGKGREGKGREVVGEKCDDKNFAFEGKVICLTNEDFNRWKETYNTIDDLNAVLVEKDGYLAMQPVSQQTNWFQFVSNQLLGEHNKNIKEQKSKPQKRYLDVKSNVGNVMAGGVA